jgi:hypothetical protein
MFLFLFLFKGHGAFVCDQDLSLTVRIRDLNRRFGGLLTWPEPGPARAGLAELTVSRFKRIFEHRPLPSDGSTVEYVQGGEGFPFIATLQLNTSK